MDFQCCLGLEFLNSNIAGEMAQLLQEPIFFDGDALTEERARNVQWTFKDGDNAFDRLEGLETSHADWHAKVNLYEVPVVILIFVNIYSYIRKLRGHHIFR